LGPGLSTFSAPNFFFRGTRVLSPAVNTICLQHLTETTLRRDEYAFLFSFPQVLKCGFSHLIPFFKRKSSTSPPLLWFASGDFFRDQPRIVPPISPPRELFPLFQDFFSRPPDLCTDKCGQKGVVIPYACQFYLRFSPSGLNASLLFTPRPRSTCTVERAPFFLPSVQQVHLPLFFRLPALRPWLLPGGGAMTATPSESDPFFSQWRPFFDFQFPPPSPYLDHSQSN